MPKVKIASKLPDGDSNGLGAAHEQLCTEDADLVVCVVMLDTKSVQVDRDTDEVTPTARIRHVEVMADAGDAREMGRLMLRQRARRTGKTVLPLDLEDELKRIVGEVGIVVDPDTGEIQQR